MKRILSISLLILALLSFFTGCNSAAAPEEQPLENIEELESEIETYEQTVLSLETQLSEEEVLSATLIETIADLELDIENLSSTQSNSLIQEALEVMELIANQNATGLNSKTSPTRGIRFSPYPYVDSNTDIVFYPGPTITSMFTNSTIYNWGTQSGSGDPISSDFSTYYNDFVYDEDFLNPELIGINTLIGSGNMINNVETEYANDQFVEFHFTGFDPNFSGMDWRSLILVFDGNTSNWELVGIVHGEWTS